MNGVPIKLTSLVRWTAALGAGLILGRLTATDPMILGISAIVALVALPLVLRIYAGGRSDPLEPIWPFVSCYAITFALKPALDRAGFMTYDWFTFDEESATRTTVIAAVALLVILVAYYSGIYRAVLKALPRVERNPSSSRLRLIAILLAAAGLAALVAAGDASQQTFALRDAVSGDYRTRVLAAAYGRGYLIVLWTLAAFAPGIQLFVALETRKVVDRGLFLAITAAVVATLTVLYSRQLILQMIVILLVVLHFKGRRLGARAIIALGLVILLAGGFLGLRLRQERPNPLEAFAFLGHTFDSFEFLSPALDHLSPVGELGGQTVLEDLALTFLPRALFPEKPEVFGIVRIQGLIAPALSGYSIKEATFPAGFLVEGFANFGYVGLFLMAIGYGVALRLAREWLMPRRDRVFVLIVYGGVVLNMTALFRSAAQCALQAVVYSAILYLALYARIPLRVRQGRSPVAA